MPQIRCQGKTLFKNVRPCTTFLQNLKGLMFSKKLEDSEALLLDCKTESRMHATIHMLFVFQTIDAIWLNSNFKIVDIKRNVRPFTLFHAPKKPARYVLELKNALSLKEGMQLRLD